MPPEEHTEAKPIKTDDYRVTPGKAVDLKDFATRYEGDMDRDEAEARFEGLVRRLQRLQELLYADGSRAVLVVLQAMDAGGKDSTIRKVFGPLNPQGCRVTGFKRPSTLELSHDYLWRIHAAAPRKGSIAVFNRSHYEDVLVVRVKGIVEKDVWKRRYDHINDFERLLADEGTAVVKFFLHISKDYQKQRLQRRLDIPEKNWKFEVGDLAERARWADYQRAFEDALGRCSTDHAPWYVVPAERRWFRNLLIASVMVRTLESLGLRYPRADFDPSDIRID